MLDILLIINVFHLTTAMSHFPKPKKFFVPEKFIMQVIDQVGIIYATLILRGGRAAIGGQGGISVEDLFSKILGIFGNSFFAIYCSPP